MNSSRFFICFILYSFLISSITFAGNPMLQGGKIDFKGGRYEKAEEKIKQAVESDPACDECYYYLGLIYIQLKRFPDVYASFQKALELNSPKWQEEIEKEGKKIWTDQYNEGVKYLNEGSYEKATNSFQNASIMNPKKIESWIALGKVLGALKKFDEALQANLKANQLDSLNTDALDGIGVYYFNKQDFEKGSSYFSKILKIAPDNRRAKDILITCYNNIGISLIQAKQYDKALEIFEKGKTIDAENPDVWNNIGLAQCQLKRFGDAIQAYSNALLYLKKMDANLVSDLVNCYFVEKKYTDATMILEKALQEDANKNNIKLILSLGVAYKELKDFEKASKTFENALEIDPKNPDVYHLLSFCYEQSGNKEKAKEILDRANKIQ